MRLTLLTMYVRLSLVLSFALSFIDVSAVNSAKKLEASCVDFLCSWRLA